MFDELVALVDPGTEPYKPTKGKINVLMAVGIQVGRRGSSCGVATRERYDSVVARQRENPACMSKGSVADAMDL